MIKVEKLNFEYFGKRVLHDVSMDIKEGAVTAMVGPNGAGKTTLMRCIVGLETPVSGTVTVAGFDVSEQPRAVHQQIGYLSDFFGLYDKLTVRQNLTYMAWCQNLPGDDVDFRVNEVADMVGMTGRMDERAGTLSRGYRQRLGIGMTLLHNPRILLLDEPASGMDPESRIGFSKLILNLRNAGHTIVVSSHILAELEDYCTDMLVIRNGRIAEHVYLSDHEKKEELSLMIAVSGLTDAHLQILSEDAALTGVERGEGDIVFCRTLADEKEQHLLLKRLLRKKLPVYRFAAQKRSLQKAYMDIAEEKGKGGF